MSELRFLRFKTKIRELMTWLLLNFNMLGCCLYVRSTQSISVRLLVLNPGGPVLQKRGAESQPQTPQPETPEALNPKLLGV